MKEPVALLFCLLLPILPLSQSCPNSCTCGPFSTVNCTGLGLAQVPKGIPENATILLLGQNQLTDLFGQLPASLSHLQELDLSRNPIKQLGRGTVFQNLTQLQGLNLSRNDFRTVFNGVFRGVPGLRTLDMQHGQIRFVEERVFEGLTQLRRLLLSHNQLNAVFPEWFKDLHLLEELRLEDNHIAYINAGCFSSLGNLRQLSLNGNRIRGVSDHAFDGLGNLTSLSLEDNLLSRVPSPSFRAVPSLKVLRLGGNSFPQLHTGDFVRLSLEEASVENIAELTLIDQGAFWDLPYLKALHLHHNSRLQFVDSKAFINVPNLRLLSLHGNNLSALSGEALRPFATPLQVSLHDNPLVCDCNIKWVHDILNSNSTSRVRILKGEGLQCQPPFEPNPVPLSSLNASQIPERCPPVLVGEPNSTVDKKIGDSYVFQCRAHGLPAPNLYWILPSGSIVNQTSNDVRIQMKNPGSLGLHHIKPKDAGQYVCVADNPLGEATSVINLIVDTLDIHLFPLGVASTFVTVVWNGTARNAFPEYEIVYRNEDDASSTYRSVTVSQFFRSYTINHLQPSSAYKFCIGVKSSEEVKQYVQFSCARVRTQDESFVMQGVTRTSNVAVGVALGVLASMTMIVCAAVVAARRYSRQRQYETPEKSLVGHMSQIPLENLHSPLMAHAGS